MGFKSAKNTNNVNQSNEEYEVDGIKFPSRFAFTTIESIDRNLRFLYSKSPLNKLKPRINYSVVRDDEENFSFWLDRVEERIERLYVKKVKAIELDDPDVHEMFPEIIAFINEGSDIENNEEDEYTKKTPDYIKRRIVYLSERLCQMGV